MHAAALPVADPSSETQHEIRDAGPLLLASGALAQRGYARRPLLSFEPRAVRRHGLGFLNRLRLKAWDFYGVHFGDHILQAAVSHVGYAGVAFVILVDLRRGVRILERAAASPLGLGASLPDGSLAGRASFHARGVALDFDYETVDGRERRTLRVSWRRWPWEAKLAADLVLERPADHDSIVMATPIGERGFYYNHKHPGLTARGEVQLGSDSWRLDAGGREGALAIMDWGRGVWAYRTFWNWATGFGRLADGRLFGLNLGHGFGDLSAATENAVFVDGRLHKLAGVRFDYELADAARPWRMRSDDGRLDLTLGATHALTKTTNLVLARSDLHQRLGHYSGTVEVGGETLAIDGVPGWAEDHRARW